MAVRVTGLSIVALAGGVKSIVCGIFWTGNDLLTGSAAAYRSSPAWEAVMVQVPALMVVSGAAGDGAHAGGVRGERHRQFRCRRRGQELPADRLRRSGGVKLIVCGIFSTGMDPVTGSAGAYLPSPGWEAVTVQVPALAVAVSGDRPRRWWRTSCVPAVVKLIVCGIFWTAKDSVTGVGRARTCRRRAGRR